MKNVKQERIKINSVHYSSNTDLWSTPQDLFLQLDSVFNFTVDVCATHENAKCSEFFTKEQDGLSKEWVGNVWMNPPYGREIGKWVKKAYESSLNNAVVVCLLPARTDTKWFHEYCVKGSVYFIKGRLKFGGVKTPAPFPSMVVVFDKNPVKRIGVYDDL
jgi:phage N-6-adenine-methyltransferase